MCVSNAFLPNIIIMSKEEKTEHKLCVLLVLSTHRCFSNTGGKERTISPEKGSVKIHIPWHPSPSSGKRLLAQFASSRH